MCTNCVESHDAATRELHRDVCRVLELVEAGELAKVTSPDLAAALTAFLASYRVKGSIRALLTGHEEPPPVSLPCPRCNDLPPERDPDNPPDPQGRPTGMQGSERPA